MNKTDAQTNKWLQEKPEDGFSRFMQAGYATEWIAVAKDREFMNLIITKNNIVVNVTATAREFNNRIEFWLELSSDNGMKSEITLSAKQFEQFMLDNQ